MADTKISNLTAASSPLSATDPLPIVQSGTTKKTTPAQLQSFMPTFSAYNSATQSITSGVATKVSLNTDEWDTASAFDTTNSKFQPAVAGYYNIIMKAAMNAAPSQIDLRLYKNGSLYKSGGVRSGSTDYANQATFLVYLNGSTDYVEFWVQLNTTQDLQAGAGNTFMQGILVRAG